MGCVSSKLFKKEIHRDILLNNGGDCINHVVSLTSSTYGALKLDSHEVKKIPTIRDIKTETKMIHKSPSPEKPEIINAWELMEDLEEGIPISGSTKKTPRTRMIRGLADLETRRSPLKFFNQFDSPKKARKNCGKENNVPRDSYFTPKSNPKRNSSPLNSCKAVLRSSFSLKATPLSRKTECLSSESGLISRRRSLTPFFDPDLVASYEKELSQEDEQIKRIVMPILPSSGTCKSKKTRESESILSKFERKCPPGGETAVVMYTTTLRGIRKTFEDCNTVRAVIETHQVQMYERDISMDSGFKEELRSLMGSKDVKVPLVFVKGRLIGGVDEIVKLEEEGKLGILLDGIPVAEIGGCEGCAGMRFVMCVECNGSCRVLDDEQGIIMVKCRQCNENGLLHCPLCCC